MLVITHIETIEAIKDLDAILATPGLDGVSLGRNDLSGPLGKLGQHTDPEVLKAIDMFFSKSRYTDLFEGCSIGCDLDTVKQWRAKGCQWFALGEDIRHFANGSKVIADAVHAID